MKCDKLLKEALDGIEFSYKLNDTLSELNQKQKFSAEQLVGFLKKKGVSPKEIDASRIFIGEDTKAKPISYWLDKADKGSHKITTIQPSEHKYSNITLGKKGALSDTYKETLSLIDKPKKYEPKLPHFSDNIPKDKTLLGWNRTHVDTIDGKPTTILNEFQSDWAQTERAGRGTFESKRIIDTSKLKERLQEVLKEIKEKELITEDKYGDDFWEIAERGDNQEVNQLIDLYSLRDSLSDKITERKIVADFPMSETKHHQYQIVRAIDEAIKNGTNRIAIPIERENELYGSKGVTKFYDSLNKKILPDIRKKLEKQGMRIKVSKEKYSSKEDKEPVLWDAVSEYWDELGLNDNPKVFDTYPFDKSFDELPFSKERYKVLKNWLKTLNIDIDKIPINLEQLNNTLHILDIEPIKGKKVKWDIYSILGAIGLGELADKLNEENVSKDNLQ